MAWTSPRTWVAAETVTAALMNTHVRDNMKAIGDAWTSYTPTWSGTLGNGTLVGKWLSIGKLVHYRIELTWGSTSSHAAANQSFTLPTAAHADYTANMHLGNGLGLDASVPTFSACAAGWLSSTTVFLVGSTGATYTNTSPWTWAVSDKLSLAGTYEAV